MFTQHLKCKDKAKSYLSMIAVFQKLCTSKDEVCNRREKKDLILWMICFG